MLRRLGLADAGLRAFRIFASFGVVGAPLVAALAATGVESVASGHLRSLGDGAVRVVFVGDASGVVTVTPVLLLATNWARYGPAQHAATPSTRDRYETVAQLIQVNVSTVQLGLDALLDQLTRAAATNGFDTSRIALELVESMGLDDVERAAHVLCRIRSLGYHVSLDDFGTGQSSISWLRHLPIDTVRIDQSFVRPPPADRDQAVIASVVALAHTFGLTVAAEGIETRARAAALRAAGAATAQGFLYGPPVPAGEFAASATPRRSCSCSGWCSTSGRGPCVRPSVLTAEVRRRCTTGAPAERQPRRCGA